MNGLRCRCLKMTIQYVFDIPGGWRSFALDHFSMHAFHWFKGTEVEWQRQNDWTCKDMHDMSQELSHRGGAHTSTTWIHSLGLSDSWKCNPTMLRLLNWQQRRWKALSDCIDKGTKRRSNSSLVRAELTQPASPWIARRRSFLCPGSRQIDFARIGGSLWRLIWGCAYSICAVGHLGIKNLIHTQSYINDGVVANYWHL